MFAKIYMGFGLLLLSGYMGMTLSGWQVATPDRQQLPQGALSGNMRQSPGGYRSFHFWHTGFHGGK